jgi:hypothetical protein
MKTVQWSKLKKRVEQFFAPSVKGRVELRYTTYRGPHGGTHDRFGRGWITYDGEEIFNACTTTFMQALAKRQEEILRELPDITPGQAWNMAVEQEDELFEANGLFSQYSFYLYLEEYCNLPIEEALESENLLIKSLSMLDRRVGKKRLIALNENAKSHPMVEQFYSKRCLAEGLNLDKN